jgi:hypothetical protein
MEITMKVIANLVRCARMRILAIRIRCLNVSISIAVTRNTVSRVRIERLALHSDALGKRYRDLEETAE